MGACDGRAPASDCGVLDISRRRMAGGIAGRMLAICLTTMLGAGTAQSDAADGDVPRWLTPEAAGEYVLIATGRDQGPPRFMRMTVYHVPTRTVVAEDWGASRGGWGGSSGRWGRIGQLVRDAPGLLWRGDALVSLADGNVVLRSSLERQAHVIAADQRRAVLIDGGDLWRGEIDWRTGEFVNRHRVTQVGVFRGNMRAIAWHGNELYLAAAFDRDNPIVRVNLVSGELAELPVPPAFNPVVGSRAQLRRGRTMGFNPPGWLVVRPEGEAVYTLDLRTDRSSTLPNPGQATRRWTAENLQWLDDTTAILETRIGIFRFDFANDRVSALTSFHDLPSGGGRWVRSLDGTITDIDMRAILPDARWAMVWGKPALPLPTGGTAEHVDYAQRQSEQPKALFLLNLASGDVEPIELDGGLPYVRQGFSPYDEWLDTRHYVFTRMEGGLAQIGTWLYDRESRQTRRLSQTPSFGGRRYLADGQSLVFTELTLTGRNTVRAGTNYVVNLDGTDVAELPAGDPFAWIDGEPIDLGLGERGSDLWAEPSPPKSVAMSELDADDGGLPAVGPTNEMRLAQATAEMDAGDQAIARAAFEQVRSTARLANHYDPVAFGLQFQREYRRLEPGAERPFSMPGESSWTLTYRHVLAEGDLTPALSRERIIRMVTARVHSMSGDADWFTPALAQAVAERYADEAFANSRRISSMRRASSLYVEVLHEQRRLAR